MEIAGRQPDHALLANNLVKGTLLDDRHDDAGATLTFCVATFTYP